MTTTSGSSCAHRVTASSPLAPTPANLPAPAGHLLPADLDRHAAQPQRFPYRADHRRQHVLGRGRGIQPHAQQAERGHRIVPQPVHQSANPALQHVAQGQHGQRGQSGRDHGGQVAGEQPP
jgi:hypothetical protein